MSKTRSKKLLETSKAKTAKLKLSLSMRSLVDKVRANLHLLTDEELNEIVDYATWEIMDREYANSDKEDPNLCP